MEYIHLGDAKMSMNQEYLDEASIECVITVASFEEFPIDPKRDKRVFYRVPILDDGMHPLRPYFAGAFKFIRESVVKHHHVLVHCMEGKSRSPSLVL
jgi:protein-tyrosine phosphatase